MHFPKSWVFKFSNLYQSLNIYLRRKIRKHSTQNDIHYNEPPSDLNKKIIIIIIYIVQHFDMFFDTIFKIIFFK